MSSYYIPADKNVIVYNLDVTRYKELSYFYDTNSTIKHCVGLIDRFLLHGLTLKGAKSHINNYLTKYFLPFFRQLLRNIVILGWCPYHLKKVKDDHTGEPILVPEVIPVTFMMCELEVNMKKVQYNYRFYDLEEQRVAKSKVKVFVFSDSELIANSTMIHSVLNGTLAEYRIVQQIKRFTIQSEYNRSNPPIYLRKIQRNTNQSSTFNQTSGTNGGSTGRRSVGAISVLDGARNFDKRETPESVKFQNASMNLADNIEFHMDEMRARSMNHQRNYYNVGLEFAPQWHNNLFICPPDMELAANPHVPDTRVDQLTMERNLSSIIYQSFGIPESIMGNLNSTQQSTRGASSRTAKVRNDVNIMDLNSFESTIEKYKNFFKDCFINLYIEIFQKKISRDVIDFKPPELYTRYIENIIAEQGLSKQQLQKEEKQQQQPQKEEKQQLQKEEKSKQKETKSSSSSSKSLKEEDTEDDEIKKPKEKIKGGVKSENKTKKKEDSKDDKKKEDSKDDKKKDDDSKKEDSKDDKKKDDDSKDDKKKDDDSKDVKKDDDSKKDDKKKDDDSKKKEDKKDDDSKKREREDESDDESDDKKSKKKPKTKKRKQ